MSGWDALLGDEAVNSTTTQSVTPVATEPVVEKMEQEIKEKLSPTPTTPVPASSTEFISKFPGIAQEMKEQASAPKIVPSSTFMGMVGHEGTGKTGLAMDAHKHLYPDGLAIVLDHDNGGLSCKQAHYRDDPSFRIFSPWVMQQQDKTAYNYLASYNRVMDVCKFAVEYAERQYEE